MGASNSVVSKNQILVLFDGVCNLCNGTVQFIIKRDSASRFVFASLQSSKGIQEMKRFNLDPTSLHSIIVIENDTFYERSDAALKIAQHLSFPWSVIGSFKVIPKVFRDKVYDLIAKNRYRLFGKQDYCMIPTRELKARFVE